MTDRLFVYGTLMRGSSHPMAKELAHGATFEAHATYRGRLYLVKTYPGVVPSADEDDIVHGDVFRLTDPKLLPMLDRYEGIGPGAAKPAEYRRVAQPVTLPDGAAVDAWIYLYDWPIGKLTRIVSGRFSLLT